MIPAPFVLYRRLTAVQDVANSGITHMSLPLTALPHITTPSLAMSLYMEIASRISHSHAIIRKKAVVSLYRLALAYPEALKLAWPKIKDRLMDDQEDSSVTTAVVNVVCELGWRRPQDLLPLAPRLFDLLVDGGNNWMAIKIIKLVCLFRAAPKAYSLTSLVCNLDSNGTAAGQEAPSTTGHYNPDNERHVIALRVHQRHCTRGSS